MYLIRVFMLAVSLLFTTCSAKADEWTGPDKQEHFGGSAVVGMLLKAKFDKLSTAQAVGIALIPGVAKELYDSRKGGSGFSYKDMVYNAAGAYVGVKLGGVIASFKSGGVQLTHISEF